MFDIGQNDLDGAFYSKSEAEVIAFIPIILTEFETVIKVEPSFSLNKSISPNGFSRTTNRQIKLSFLLVVFRDCIMRVVQGSFGSTALVPLDAYLESLQHLEKTHPNSTSLDA